MSFSWCFSVALFLIVPTKSSPLKNSWLNLVWIKHFSFMHKLCICSTADFKKYKNIIFCYISTTVIPKHIFNRNRWQCIGIMETVTYSKWRRLHVRISNHWLILITVSALQRIKPIKQDALTTHQMLFSWLFLSYLIREIIQPTLYSTY